MSDRKVALITGANKGIGLEIGRQLAERGFTAILAGRDEGRVNEAAQTLKAQGLDVVGRVLDVTDPASAEAAAAWVEQTYGRLDVLVNNAGVSLEFQGGTPPTKLTLDTFRKTYDTNVFGVFSVIQAMLPLLRKTAPARIINLSSTLGSLAVASDRKSPWYGVNLLAYNSSKTALNGISVAFSKELERDKISVNSVCPGWVKTDMGTDAAPRSVDQGAAISVKLATMDDPPTGQYLDDNGVIPW